MESLKELEVKQIEKTDINILIKNINSLDFDPIKLK